MQGHNRKHQLNVTQCCQGTLPSSGIWRARDRCANSFFKSVIAAAPGSWGAQVFSVTLAPTANYHNNDNIINIIICIITKHPHGNINCLPEKNISNAQGSCICLHVVLCCFLCLLNHLPFPVLNFACAIGQALNYLLTVHFETFQIKRKFIHQEVKVGFLNLFLLLVHEIPHGRHRF